MASETNGNRKTRRRDLLLGAGALLAVGGGWQAWVQRPQPFDFAEIEGLPDWRQLTFDGVTRPGTGPAGAALLGLEGPGGDRRTLQPSALCRTLFGAEDQRGVPVAVFSDFFCPYCRKLTPRIAKAADDGTLPIRLTWHELPLLGPSSEVAARAALAADLQDGYAAYQQALIRSQFRPTMVYLGETATAAGLSGPQLVFDMDDVKVRRRLADSRAAARTLGIYGTPALVVGRTLVMGAISDRDLARLVDLEADSSPVC